MNCLTPVIRAVHHYVDVDGKSVPVSTDYYLCSCGHCVPCLLSDQRDWALRLQLEYETSETAWFLTMTYDDDHLPADKCVAKSAIQKFMNHLRKRLERICKERGVKVPRLTYFAVGEYGRKTNRPHYHMMLFGFPVHSAFQMLRIVEDVWRKGFCKVESCCVKTCNYIAKYMTKIDPRPHVVDSFRLMSRRPAIGFTYLQRPDVIEYLNRPNVSTIRLRDGKCYRIPRAVQRRFFSNSKRFDSRESCKKDCDWLLSHASAYHDYIVAGERKNQQLLERLFRKFV